MPELRFAITQQPLRSLSQAATEICRKSNAPKDRVLSLLQPLPGDFRSNDVTSYGQLTQVLATLAVLAEESLAHAYWVNPSLDGWQSQLSLSKDQGYAEMDPGIQKAWIILHTQSFRYIHINDRDLPQSFQMPGLIHNTTHAWLLRPPMPSRPSTQQIINAHRLNF